ncbi:hypothetical protein P5P86_16000 [Nocardioides sp. BP30]|uniref:hypothetical protein n=1 Tax=Nocardioides sp. BP30 TaxID=3036374 RepID=UPI002468E3DA|nr:hypothetical protein [Nocardioides sp. BP30]WGL51456.1 hypothetical protein P5P86_16000 [Nocardioides sp. BP30]
MGSTECLKESVQRTYDGLADRLDAAAQVTCSADHSRRGCPPIDMLCACVSQHLHAVDEVLLPCLPMQRDTHDYRAAEHEMAIVLSHVKAHEFGSSYETGFSWSRVWDAVLDAMVALRREEEAVVLRLGDLLNDDELRTMTDQLEHREPYEPTRPHPYLPHRGTGGQVARRVMRVVDGFWDATEGRYVPAPVKVVRKPPGRVSQYFMGNPRIGDPGADD